MNIVLHVLACCGVVTPTDLDSNPTPFANGMRVMCEPRGASIRNGKPVEQGSYLLYLLYQKHLLKLVTMVVI